MPKPKQYWLHIRDDGTEQVFDAPPENIPTLRVERLGKWEQTWTHNIVLIDDPKGKHMPKSVTPKGQGWELFATICEPGSTAWRRKRRAR